MAVTAIYFVSHGQSNAPALPDLTDRFIRAYDALPTGSWGLHHRLFRSTPASTTDRSPPALHHVLALGHYPNTAFVHIVAPEDAAGHDATTVAIPPAQMEPYANLLNLKFGALWMYRMSAQVTNGASYSLGEFTVRMGEVREKSGQMSARGIVVCIQTAKREPADADDDDDDDEDDDADGLRCRNDPQQDIEAGQALVREVWSSFGVQGAKEVITSQKAGHGDEAVSQEVNLWCEVLRFQK